MKKYLVKSLFTGWHEVTEDDYRAYIENLRKGSTNIPQEKKDDFIAQRTKVIDTQKTEV